MDTGGGGTVGSQFDDAGRITVSNPGAEHEETYTYDNNGNLTSITSPSLPYHNRVYGYDALDRLEHAEGPWGVIDYTYDNMGNKLTKTVDSVTDTYAYVTGTNIIDSITNGAATTYTHDANGNTTGINNKILTYNQNNRLIMVEEDSVTLGEYTYNGLGQRIIKEADGVTTVFHYDFDGNIIGESDAAGSFSKEYLYRGSSRLAMVEVASGEIYFYGNDHLGTPIILTDSTNTVVWEAVYKPFGEAEVNPNSEIVSNFRFKGQYYDNETGFHYNYHRYYEPLTGRYLRPDPIGQVGGINFFVYAENNPVNAIDIIGLKESTTLKIVKYGVKDVVDASKPSLLEGIKHFFWWGQRNIDARIADINKLIKYHQDEINKWYDHCLNACRRGECNSTDCRENCLSDYFKDYQNLITPYVNQKARLMINPSWSDKWFHYSVYSIKWSEEDGGIK